MSLTFTLTADHITLLRHAYVDWQHCETGAPAIDPKRPYGNSGVAYDIIQMLKWGDPEDISERMEDRALALHRETETALQIVLVTGAFEPGTYRKTETYDSRSWERVP